MQTSWWGYYEMSPDHNALVGHAADPDGFFYATGFSGHGFQQAPAVGEHVAELVAGREPTLDLSRVRRRAVRARAFQARDVRHMIAATPGEGVIVENKRVSDSNKHLMQRVYDEVINEGNLDLIDELFAETFVEHEVFPASRRPARASSSSSRCSGRHSRTSPSRSST